MSKQEKRSRGKRPRYDSGPSREVPQVPGFAPVNTQPQSNPPFANSTQSPPLTAFQSQSGPSGQQALHIAAQPPPGKVAIPALRTPQTSETSKGFKKGRTPHACDYCRKAKAGCTGGQPCTRCRNAVVECVYGDGKRDRDRKRMSKLSRASKFMTQHQNEVIEALRRIRLDTHLSSDDMRAALDDVIAMTPNAVRGEEGEEYVAPSKQESSDAEDEDFSDESSARAGSTGSLDIINVDIDQEDTRATGHIGKSSAVAWAKRIADECVDSTQQETYSEMHDMGYVKASYHTEDDDVIPVETSNVDPYAWPESIQADRLVQSYFDHVHNVLPILDKADFTSRYDQFVRGSMDLDVEDRIWLATVNTMFAISSVFFNLTRAARKEDFNDHVIFCTRARMLYLDNDVLSQDARISLTSALGLLCLYFLAVNKINRAWTTGGLAIRHGLTLGLHVQSMAKDLPDVLKERRVRLWWSLYSLEYTLSGLTGRPSCISDRDISTPLPLNMNEDDFHPDQVLYDTGEMASTSKSSSRRGSKPRPTATYQMPSGVSQPVAYTFPALSLPMTPSTYFIYRVQLSIISHEILTQLYCAATTKERWTDVQETLKRIDRRLVTWRDKLTSDFDIAFEDTWTCPDWSDPNMLTRLGLAMQFTSSRMILFRPGLCRFEGRLKKQSEDSKDFNQHAVETCIHSARKMIALVALAASSVEKLYAIPPWWNTLHYICSALSVLMLEMAFKAIHLPAEAAYMLEDAKKGIRWLSMMAAHSLSARKAWEIFDRLLRHVAPRIRWSVFDMPQTAPVPPGYKVNWNRFDNIESEMGVFSTPPSLNLPEDPSSSAQHQQLPESNLNRYSAAQPRANLWQSSTGTNTGTGLSTGGIFTDPSTWSLEQMANPLNHNTALARFAHMGQLHGHYDDPWQHYFAVSHPESNLTLNSGDEFGYGVGLSDMGAGMGSGLEQQTGSEARGYGGGEGMGTGFASQPYQLGQTQPYGEQFGGEGPSSGSSGGGGLRAYFGAKDV